MNSSTTPYFMNLGGRYVIIENVPCYRCRKCNEVYFDAVVQERLDEMISAVDGIESRIFLMDYWYRNKAG